MLLRVRELATAYLLTYIHAQARDHFQPGPPHRVCAPGQLCGVTPIIEHLDSVELRSMTRNMRASDSLAQSSD